MVDSCKFVSVPTAEEAEIKGTEQREKWKKNMSHVEE